MDGIRHLIGVSDITTSWWNSLFSLCREIIAHPQDYSDANRGKVMASLFFEPSTRTKFSFQAAMLRLGGSVFGFENANDTSASKGESLADTIRMTSAYSDVVVMRSPSEGAARAASLYSEVPLVNAGDGGHQHPTQTLTDLATLAVTRGEIRDLTVGLCGDLRYGRTVHSLVEALAKFPNIRFVLTAPPELAMPDYVTRFMRARNLTFTEVPTLDDALPQLDVLYMTRVQRERVIQSATQSTMEYSDDFILTRDKLARAKRDLTILHPLPRVNEIAPEVDLDPRAKYFDQARYGMYIRMALLLKLCAQPRTAPEPVAVGGAKCANPACITRREPYLPDLRNDDGGCGYCDVN
ncbi:MAG: aspartate carbamoyltransferase [Oscillospiraceae bacterium]|jgi:aspartate carbamoyltransferase catalytic subunit|nr:aspartate carbamoyltransferase [Oscillospiraceae bacterium]